MTSYRRIHDARRETQAIIDRMTGVTCIPVASLRWRRMIASGRGPRDPLARLVMLAIGAHYSSGELGLRVTHRDIARITRLAERTVRSRIAWAMRAGWLIVDGPRTRRVYRPAIPIDLRHVVPDHPGQMRHPMPDTGASIRHDMPPDDDDDLPRQRPRRPSPVTGGAA